VQILKLVN